MRCPTCGAEPTRRLVRIDVPEEHRRIHHRACPLGHHFWTTEVHFSQLANGREFASAVRGLDRRLAIWRRNEAIALDPRSSHVVAEQYGISSARVRQIRAQARAHSVPPPQGTLPAPNLERTDP
jgi:hypothetical protein